MNRIKDAGLACAGFAACEDEMQSREKGKGKREKGTGTFHSPRLGFTLAEVLITLTILGLVAALTIPELVKNMNNYAFGKAKEVTLMKIKEATNQMKSNDVLAGYTTNASFLNEFQKYMKVSKTCDSSNLTNCFAPKFKLDSGTEILTNTLVAGTNLDPNNITGSTVALMLANGTSVLLSLRDATKVGTDCDRIDPVNNTSDTTSCLSFLYDINGFGSPNILGRDIGYVSVNGLGCAGVKVGSTCFSSAFVPTPMSSAACYAAIGGPLGIKECDSDTDYWAGAVAHCGGVSKMPTQEQLDALANKLYGLSTCGVSTCNGDLISAETAKLGLPATGPFAIWSSEETTSVNAFSRIFNTANSYRFGMYTRDMGLRGICVGN